MTKDQLIDNLKRRRGSQREIAGALGVSEAYLSDVLNARREPGEKLLKAMGLERVVTYRVKR